MFGEFPFRIIEERKELIEVCELLKQREVLGVDLESDSLYHYREKICLIQVSDIDTDYIIDPLKIKDLDCFLDILSDANIKKVMHGSDFDVVSLKRDYQVQIENLFDTLIAAQFLGYAKLGLVNLIDKHFGIELDKKYQKHDWSQRPLLSEHLHYARGDTHWLIALEELLSFKLAQANLTAAAQEECQLLTYKEWNGRLKDPQGFLRIKNAKSLQESEKKVLRCVWEYRETVGERLDRPVFKVFSNQLLLSLAQKQPASKEELVKLISRHSRIATNYGEDLLEAVQKGQNDSRPIILPTHKKSRKSGPYFERIMSALKNWRNARMEKLHLAPVMLFSNGQLRDIALSGPETPEELEAIESVRKWQVKAYSEEILPLIAGCKVRGKKRKRSK